MKTQLFPSKLLAQKILDQCGKEAAAFTKSRGRQPKLTVVIVGEDPASQVYVKKKTETCAQYGIEGATIALKPSEGFSKLESIVNQLNQDPNVDGILVQAPLPKGWDEKRIQALINPAKDVDGFHPLNAGLLSTDTKNFLQHGLPPCTPAGVMEILKEAGISCEGKHAVVLGRSNIVGKPMAQMLLAENATVTICHSKTKNISAITKEADIIVAAIGIPKFLHQDHIKKGAVLIDVGINRVEEKGRKFLVGDIDAKSVDDKAGFLTPVPGGVGPMTIAILLRNLIRAATASANAKHQN